MDALTGLVIGLHLFSTHVPNMESTNNVNPGLYARTADGWQAGVYMNTLDRTSVYVAKAFSHGPFSLVLGAMSGYQEKTTEVPAVGADGSCKTTGYAPCYQTQGHTRGAIGPMLALSYAAPEILGTTPRLSVMPGWGDTHTVIHLSVEWKL
jgi:hypothetical protein